MTTNHAQFGQANSVLKAADLPLTYNAVDILERNLATRADKVALYSRERSLTFQAVADEANQVGQALLHLGVRFGECVGILAPDSAEWVTSFFGTIKIGAIAICMNTLLQTHEYEYILRDSRARVLIIHESLLPAIAPLRNQLTTLPQLVVIGQSANANDLIFADWISAESTQLAPAQTHRDDFCSLHYSSGTTGQPKGVFHAHKDYPLIAHNSGFLTFGFRESDRTFSVAKLFFVYGLGGNLVFSWYAGASCVLYGGSTRAVSGLLETIDLFQPTVLFSVPTAYIAKLATPNIATRYNLSSLRLCISGGEALPASVWENWKEQTGLEILNAVGCTESYHTFLANLPGALRPGSSGKPTAGYEAKVIDEAGNEVEQGTIGNLMIKGESISLFYLHQYERSRLTFRGEWLFTGDKYYVDQDGYYWHCGRTDDMLKVGGLWVSPVEVESVLTAHAAVLECAVVGQQDANQMFKPKAIIRLKEGVVSSDSLTRQLLQHCSEQLPAHKCPRWFEYVDDLPKTATGKIQRFKLRQEGMKA